MDEYKLNVVMVGDSGVGKTSLFFRFIKNDISNPDPAIVDTKSVNFVENNCQIKMDIKDTTGNEEFSFLTPTYFKDAQGVIFVYDVNRLYTLKQLGFWMNEMKKYSTVDNVVAVLVGTKIDIGRRQVSTDQGSEFASKHDMLFFETSAFNAESVDTLFKNVANEIIKKQFKI